MSLDNRELREMRSAADSLLPDFCNLLTVSSTSDGQGGFTEAWGTVTRNVPCRVDQQIGSERLTDGSLRAFTSLEMAIPYDTTITEEYQVEHGDYTYHVVNANPVFGIEEQTMVRIEGGAATVAGRGRVKVFRRGADPRWYAAGERLPSP